MGKCEARLAVGKVGVVVEKEHWDRKESFFFFNTLFIYNLDAIVSLKLCHCQ